VIIHNCDQYSDEWWSLRRGLPTASQFSRIITPRGALSKSMFKYAAELRVESSSTGDSERGYQSAAMKHGAETEGEARKYYESDAGVEVIQVGLCVADDGSYGGSPDGLVGDDGCLEIKCPLRKTHADYLRSGALPAQYRPQVHGHLLVTGRAWCDFLSYCPDLPALIVRVRRDSYTEKLGSALRVFSKKLAAMR